MLDNINILKLASAMARYAADRHQLLSQNIANADTNDFKAKDLEPFSEAYARLSDRNGKMPDQQTLASIDKPWRTTAIHAPGITSPNGNTVSLEDQMMRSIEAQQDHETATVLYKKTIDILRTSLGRGA